MEPDKPTKAKNPAKLKVLRGSADDFVPLREQLMGAEGLEPVPQNTGETAPFEIPGAHTGAIDSLSDLQGPLKTHAIANLQKAWEALRRLVDQSGSPAESRAAGRALAFVNRAFEELEEGE